MLQNGNINQNDDFIKAIVVAFSQSNVNDSVKAQATAYCKQLEASPDGWRLCLQKLAQYPNGPEEMKFWCVGVISQTVAKRYDLIQEAERAVVRSSLLVYVRDVVSVIPLSVAVKNKLAVLFVRLIKNDYPEHWPSVFHDFLGMLPRSAQIVDLFLRVLKTIDEEVVEFDERRSAQEIQHNTLIKDTMKAQVMDQLVGTLQNIISGCQDSEPTLAARCLVTLKEYIGWINIKLVDRLVPLWYELLRKPQLRIGACECITSVINKRMVDPLTKLFLLLELQPLDAIAKLEIQGGDESFLIKTAALVNSIGLAVLDFFTGSTSPDAQRALTTAKDMLSRALQLAFAYLQHSNYVVSNEVLKFIMEYVSTMKQSTVGSWPVDTIPFRLEVNVEHIRILFGLVLKQSAIPSWYNFDQPDDEEKVFDNYRNELSTLFKNLGILAPELLIELLRGRLVHVFQNLSTTSFPELEGVLWMFWLLPEAIPKVAKQLNTPPLKEMVMMFLASGVSGYAHKKVSITYFDLVVRYSRFFEGDNDSQLLWSVVSSFMDQRGMHNSDAAVRNRACYLFLRLIKLLSIGLKRKLAAHIDQILSTLQTIIQPVLMRAQGVQSGSKLVSYSSVACLCQSIGLLITTSSVGDSAKCRQYFSNVIESFRMQIELGLQHRAQWMRTDPNLAGKRLSQVVDAINCLCKPFAADAQYVSDLLGASLNSVLQVLALLPQHEMVRLKTINFLHIIVDLLKDNSAPFVQAALGPLLQSSSHQNLIELMELISQIVLILKEKISVTMTNLFIPIIARNFEAMQYYSQEMSDPSAKMVVAAYAEERQMLVNLQKNYFTFLRNMVSSNLVDVITAGGNVSHLQTLLRSLLQGASEIKDLATTRNVFSILSALLGSWTKTLVELLRVASLLVDASLRAFLLTEVTSRCFQVPLQSNFDLDDAVANNVLSEIIDVQKNLYAALGQDFLEFFVNFLKSNIGLNQQQAQDYVQALQSAPVADFKKLFKMILHHKRQFSLVHGRS